MHLCVATRAASSGAAGRSLRALCIGSADAEVAPKVLVYGGNGYVGGAVCRALLAAGARVVSVNRSGRPLSKAANKGSWAIDVKWVKGNALDPEPWMTTIANQGPIAAAVSCVGAFGSQEQMRRINGDANVALVNATKAAGAQRYCFVSAIEIPLMRTVLGGYYDGKLAAEAAVRDQFGDEGCSLRPSFVYGARPFGKRELPLHLVGAPMRSVLTSVPLHGLPGIGPFLQPPVSVESVADAAAKAVLQGSPGQDIVTFD